MGLIYDSAMWVYENPEKAVGGFGGLALLIFLL